MNLLDIGARGTYLPRQLCLTGESSVELQQKKDTDSFTIAPMSMRMLQLDRAIRATQFDRLEVTEQ